MADPACLSDTYCSLGKLNLLLCTVGVCSDYLDVGTTFNRLVYVVKLLTHNGIYVLLDNQFNLDTTVLDDQNRWLSDWLSLLRAVAQDPISASMLMIDVLNVSCIAKWSKQVQHLFCPKPLSFVCTASSAMFIEISPDFCSTKLSSAMHSWPMLLATLSTSFHWPMEVSTPQTNSLAYCLCVYQ